MYEKKKEKKQAYGCFSCYYIQLYNLKSTHAYNHYSCSSLF